MPDVYTQQSRFLRIETPLGDNKLLMRSFSGQEEISKLFSFQVDLVSNDFNVNFKQIVGHNITISMRLADDTERYFNGYVSRFAQMPGENRLARYQIEMVPWLWFLTRTTDCRIFQNMTVPDIIEEVFHRFGFTDYELQLRNTYDEWEYCVQYRETACNFLMRLMEQEGIFFFFRHENGKHVLVLGDFPLVHKPCPNQSRVRYEHVSNEGRLEEDTINGWRLEQEFRPGKYTLKEYYFETPSSSLLSSIEGVVKQNGNRRYEIYDYPGEYERRGEGDGWVRLRMEEVEAQHAVVRGSGNCRSFSTGFRFDLLDHERTDQNTTYLLTSITHHAHQPGFESGADEAGEHYSNIFTCIPCSVPFRPPRLTPKPLIQGTQTAIVVGPAGEEIYVDNYSRVKVQFHWDRVGQRNEHSSCWIRVSQPWAGKGWGGISIPRIGQEVVIDFLEGDPDRPIITGRVYNAEQMPPYALPGNKTQSGLKSRSSKGGSPSNFNEVRFEDLKGSEELYIQAEKDENILVKNDKSETVGHDETIHILNDRTETVDGHETLTVHKNRTRNVTQNEVVTVNLTRTHTVGINEAINIGAAQEVTVGAMRMVTVGLSQTTSVGINNTLLVGKNLSIAAGDQITIKTGKASITMKKDGSIAIKGKNILIEGSGKITGKASGNIILKGSKILEN